MPKTELLIFFNLYIYYSYNLTLLSHSAIDFPWQLHITAASFACHGWGSWGMGCKRRGNSYFDLYNHENTSTQACTPHRWAVLCMLRVHSRVELNNGTHPPWATKNGQSHGAHRFLCGALGLGRPSHGGVHGTMG